MQFPKRELTKRCKKCKVVKSKQEFYSKQAVCKPCSRKQSSARAAKHREYAYNYLQKHGCVDCGETDPIILEFDHVRGEKLFTIGQSYDHSLKALKEEIAKCEVRCANCHRRVTWQRNQGRKVHNHEFDTEAPRQRRGRSNPSGGGLGSV